MAGEESGDARAAAAAQGALLASGDTSAAAGQQALAAAAAENASVAKEGSGSVSHEEMVTNPLILGCFESIVHRPGLYFGMVCLATLIFYPIAQTRLELCRQHVEVHLEGGRLKPTLESLSYDFPNANTGIMWNGIMVWCTEKCDLRADPRYPKALDKIRHRLDFMRKDAMCDNYEVRLYNKSDANSSAKEMSDKEVFSKDGTAALSKFVLKDPDDSLNPGQMNTCMLRAIGEIDKDFNAIDGLHISFATEEAVLMANAQAETDRMMEHLMISAIFLTLLMWYFFGSIARAITPMIVLACSIQARDVVMVIIKHGWKDMILQEDQSQAVFVQLALSLDYSIFFWNRLWQEREKNPGREAWPKAILTTMKTSGLVIAVSVMVLELVFVVCLAYPESNLIGITGSWLTLMAGILFCGIYSVAVPSALAAKFPFLFDNHDGFFCLSKQPDFVKPITETPARFFRWYSSWVTKKPWMIVVPMVGYALLMPGFCNFFNYEPNYDGNALSIVKHSNLGQAFTAFQEKYNAGSSNPVQFVMSTRQLGKAPDNDAPLLLQLDLNTLTLDANDDEAAAGNKTPVVLTEAYRIASCRFIEQAINRTKGKVFAVEADSVDSIWWDKHSGKCSKAPMPLQRISEDGTKEVMLFAVSIGTMSTEAADMTKFFWHHFEDESEGKFIVDGMEYSLSGRHYTGLSFTMSLDERMGQVRPYILLASIVLIAMILGFTFKSIGVSLKILMTVVVPIVAAFGLSFGVFQSGWIPFLGHKDGGFYWAWTYSAIPFLLGLAVDYDVVFLARVYERRMQGYDNISAVKMAIAEACPMIELAGTLMCLAFVPLAVSQVDMMKQVGLLYLMGAAIDTYMVRVLIAPTVMALGGWLNYWPGAVPKETKTWDPYEGGTAEKSSAEKS